MSTVAAISTPNAAGGIGIIRISGEDAIGIAEKCFRPVSGKKVSSMKGYSAAYGTFFDGKTDIDDGVLLIYRAPKSYTGEDVAEICCHGGMFLLQKALGVVLSLGAEPAGPGEFTKRAFLNGKMDLSQAESVMKIISAQGDGALSAARGALNGSVSKKIDGVCSLLLSSAAALAVWADYPDEDIPAVENIQLRSALSLCREKLKKLIADYENGKAATEGVRTVICGKPNVGKSTVMNLLAGYNRSIVTPIAGTTRDAVEETVRIGNVLLRISDTAGLRETDDIVESIGVSIAKERIMNASLIIAVFDSSVPLDEQDEEILRSYTDKLRVAVINKTDLPCALNIEKVKKYIPRAVEISAREPESLDSLRSLIEDTLGVAGMDFSQELLSSARQKNCCVSALKFLDDAIGAIDSGFTPDAVSVDIDCAINELLTLTGKKASQEVVNEVFKNFCVGK